MGRHLPGPRAGMRNAHRTRPESVQYVRRAAARHSPDPDAASGGEPDVLQAAPAFLHGCTPRAQSLMPGSYLIDVPRRIVFSRGWGKVTEEEVLAHARALR